MEHRSVPEGQFDISMSDEFAFILFSESFFFMSPSPYPWLCGDNGKGRRRINLSYSF